MTYCAALRLKDGIIFTSDTRTNAGIDQIGVYKKMYTFCTPGERAIFIQTAGNLATSQGVLHRLSRDIEMDRGTHLLNIDSLYAAAVMIGDLSRKIAHHSAEGAMAGDVNFTSTFIIGGQIIGQLPQLYMVYSEGNCISATIDTPFFQLGESKYGKPILDRSIAYDSSLDDGIRAMMVSFDSTLRSNLSVGMPLDLCVYRNDSFITTPGYRITADDPYFSGISSRWSQGLRDLLVSFPPPPQDYYD